MSTQRPKFSPEIARLAAEWVIAELIADGHLEEHQRSQSVADLAKYARRSMDGYEIAKYLDDYAGWAITFDMVEVLDGFRFEADGALRHAQEEWAALAKPEAILPIGTHVRIDAFATGEITGIYEHGLAQYLVKIPGKDGHRIVNFEDAKLEGADA